MRVRTQRRWRLYALPAAGVLFLLLVSRIFTPRQDIGITSDPPPRPAAQASVQDTPHTSTGATRVPPKPPRSRPAQPHGDSNEVRHLSDLNRTPDEDQLLWAAEEELVTACMHRRGFSYVPNSKDDDPEAEPGHVPVNRRGDVGAARREGYGLVRRIQDGDSPKRDDDRNAEALARMTSANRAAFLEALRGPDTSAADPSVRHLVERVPLPGGGAAYWYRDSCLAYARHQLYSDDYEHNEIGYSQAMIRADLLARADEDPEYNESLHTWRSCMHERGFDDDQPAAAATRLASEYHGGKLSLDELRTREVAVATADTECFVAAGLERARQAAESRAEAEILDENREKLVAMQHARDEAIKRAETVLDDTQL
jgi:hypothetical protein